MSSQSSFQPPCGACGETWDITHAWCRGKAVTAPRVATSLDDLKVGMVVASYVVGEDPEVIGGRIARIAAPYAYFEEESGGRDACGFTGDNTITILDDAPPTTPVTVPRAAFDRLAEIVADHPDYTCDLLDPARAVVASAQKETE